MFHSIRWRLVLYFILFTLLTVTALGVLLLSLMRRTIDRQTTEALRANAESLAARSLPFFYPIVQEPALYQLAQTTAFLGDVQVRILDDQQQVLVDSGQLTNSNEVAWVLQENGATSGDGWQASANVIMIGSGNWPEGGHEPYLSPTVFTISATTPSSVTAPLAWPANSIIVRRQPGIWGDRLFYEAINAAPMPGVPTDLLAAHVAITEFSAGQLLVTESTLFTQEIEAPVAILSPAVGEPGVMERQVITADWAIDFAAAPNRVTMPIQVGNQTVGFVEVGSAPTLASEALAAIRQALLVAAGIVSLLAVLVGLVVSKGLTAPLAGLMSTTDRMNQGDLTARAPVSGNDEIGALARQFNQMAAALENSFAALAAERDALRRFVADASHELRTPITALRTFNEILQNHAAQLTTTQVQANQDVTTQREFLTESQTQIDRLERITRSLLSLSRLEGGLVQLTLAEYDVTELLATVAAPFRLQLEERGIELLIQSPKPPVVYRCDHTQIEMAISNLLDNAIKFTPSGSVVQIGAQRLGDQLHIWVMDNGAGIEDEELPYIFERFHRGRNARYDGSGLGLAIAQSIVRSHGGTIEAASTPGVETEFIIKLPLNGLLGHSIAP